MATYPLTISTAFPYAKVSSDRFTKEIQDSTITAALDGISTLGDVCTVVFKAALSEDDETTFYAKVAMHTGEPLPENTLTKVQTYVAEGVVAPVASDGKPFVLPNSFPGEVLLNFTGCSDQLSPPVRFGGAMFGVQQVGIGESAFELDFLDGIFMAGGHIEWDGGSWGSTAYLELVAPASTVKAPASPNTGNCNVVPTGFPGLSIVVPAMGNGAYDLDYPVPIPANDDETYAHNGYWNYSEPWLGKGVTSPAAPGTGKYNLFTSPLELAHFAKIHIFLPSGQRDMIAPAIKPKWLLPEWKMKVLISNADATKTLRLSADLLIARRKTV